MKARCDSCNGYSNVNFSISEAPGEWVVLGAVYLGINAYCELCGSLINDASLNALNATILKKSWEKLLGSNYKKDPRRE